jgi:4-hydroxy-3-polyprenylbenzoate decarboxylase
MIHTCTQDIINDLEKHHDLIRIPHEVDPDLEMAEIHRRVYRAGGPAIFFEHIKGSPFPAASNLFGTLARARFIFRDTLNRIQRLMEVVADPALIFKSPHRCLNLPITLWQMLPRNVTSGPVLTHKTSLEHLPQIRCWPGDGGAFVLLPQVYTEDPARPGIMHSNLGMYRIQISGNHYVANREAGLHYQIRRDIGIHHAAALSLKQPLRVSVFVGGPPAHTFSAIMPLPEGMPEVTFAGGLAGRRFRYARRNGYAIAADADFCICGTVCPGETKPEGPFGDHLGYYSLAHPFPVLHVDTVYHRPDAVWPFTVVGRPPQEDTIFGRLIHEITGPMVPRSIPGVKSVHAVDAAGVHPLLLAIGKERFLPYEKIKPRELLKLAHAILGFGHCSLAKYLFIAAEEDAPGLDVYDLEAFFRHVLERVDWRKDLHFQTETFIDTLDYSGTGLNEGSKVVIAAAGPRIRNLMPETPGDIPLTDGFSNPMMVMPGILAIQGPAYSDVKSGETAIYRIAEALSSVKSRNELPLVVIVDDSEFAARTIHNFLWTTFTRSNPSHDIYGVNSHVGHKHWGCEPPLIIDARLKPFHAPPLVEDPKISARVNELGKKGGCLYGII